MTREQRMIDAIRKRDSDYKRMFDILLRMIRRREHFKTAINVYVYDETVEVVFPMGVRDVIRD